MSNSRKYNSSYKYSNTYELPMSLITFLNEKAPLLCGTTKVIEMGSGAGCIRDSLNFLDRECEYTCLDISENAINYAREHNLSNATYLINSIFDFKPSDKFDLIIDSHLFHCLEGENEINHYLETVNSVLEDEGLFVVETMVASKDFLNSSNDYRNNEKYFVDGEFNRTLFTHKKIEEILLLSDFDITFLSFPVGLKMILDSKRSEVMDGDPDIVRFILKKKPSMNDGL